MQNTSLVYVNNVPMVIQNDILWMYNKDILSSYCDFIGEGKSGVIYRYYDYVIKIFKKTDDELYSDKDPIILEKLQGNPCFPKLYFYQPNHFMVYEWVQGDKLFDLLDKHQKPSLNWELKVKGAVKFCLSKNIYPYDLTEQNILFDKNNQPKIVDVGLFDELHNVLEEDKEDYLRETYDMIDKLKTYY